tara:strand:+ start:1260 stop:1433 length:174 start_codon:yes stop_codon:yes gene_type:complete
MLLTGAIDNRFIHLANPFKTILLTCIHTVLFDASIHTISFSRYFNGCFGRLLWTHLL